MAARRFHKCSGPLTAAQLASALGLELHGDGTRLIHDAGPLNSAGAQQLSFLDNIKYRQHLASTKAGVVIVKPQFLAEVPKGTVVLVTNQPYAAFGQALQMLFPEPVGAATIDSSANVHTSAKLGQGVTLEAGVVIDAGAALADGVWVGANSYIGPEVFIGQDTRIHSCVSIVCASVGARCQIHGGVRIGQDGFGFALDGKTTKIPQIGLVEIGDDVEIGANTCIDRGAQTATKIGSRSRLDNLVQIGHNVELGEGCVVVSQTGIAGSTILGNNVVIGGQVGIAGHLKIADRVMIAARSGVTKSILKVGEVVSGFPAQPIAQWRKAQARLSRLLKNNNEASEDANTDA